MVTFSFLASAQEGDDAASASATGAAAPSKGAPKSAQANTKLRVLHIAVQSMVSASMTSRLLFLEVVVLANLPTYTKK